MKSHGEAEDSGDRGRAIPGRSPELQPGARRVRGRSTSFDGPEGLRQAQLKLPDLIVLDLMLPQKSGLDVCRELKQGQRTREIPIIMVTAKAEESDQLVGLRDRCRRLRHQALQREDPDRADQERAAPAPAEGRAGLGRIDREPGHRHRPAQPPRVLSRRRARC